MRGLFVQPDAGRGQLRRRDGLLLAGPCRFNAKPAATQPTCASRAARRLRRRRRHGTVGTRVRGCAISRPQFGWDVYARHSRRRPKPGAAAVNLTATLSVTSSGCLFPRQPFTWPAARPHERFKFRFLDGCEAAHTRGILKERKQAVNDHTHRPSSCPNSGPPG